MSPRRSFVLLGVLILITLSSAVSGSLLLIAESTRADATAALSRMQSRALAWSAIQAVMAELAAQREELIRGGEATPTRSGQIYTIEGGESGVYELVNGGAGGATSEQAKIDVNSATAEMLAALPGLSEQTASAIVAARESAPFASIDDLLEIDGVSYDALYHAGDPPSEARFDAEQPERRALADLLTVYSFDPVVQAGMEGGEAGAKRINLGLEWSDRLRRAIADRWDDQTAELVATIFRQRDPLEDAGDLARLLLDRGVPTEMWSEVFDVITTTEAEYEIGKVDINRAPAAVLAALPGLDANLADEIVAARESLDDAVRRGIAWPVTEGIVSAETFAELAPWVATRSLQWRVRIVAGIRPESQTAADGEDFGLGEAFDPALAPADLEADQFGVAIEPEDAAAELQDRMLYEAVIDVSSTRPRVAYLADVTLEETAAMLADRSGRAREQQQTESDPPDAEGAEPVESQDPAPGPFGVSSFGSGFAEEPRAEEPRADPFAAPPTPPDEPPNAGEPEQAGEPEGDATPRDPRLGRWTRGRQGSDS